MLEALLNDPTFYVALAFFVVLGALAYLRVPRRILGLLDDRAAAIGAELDAAQRLRDEAEKLRDEYRQRHADAEKQAEAIVADARANAARLAEEARAALQATVERRTRQAEERITRAEAQMVDDVRAATIALAVEAARQIVVDTMTSERADALIDAQIADLPQTLSGS